MPRRVLTHLRYLHFADAHITQLVPHGRGNSFQAIVLRHWAAVAAYLHTCFSHPPTALLNTERVFSHNYEDTARSRIDPTISWRVHLLVTARALALREWSRAPESPVFSDGFRAWAESGGTWPLTVSPHLTEAYGRLPGGSRSALWHSVVEADPPALTAQVLGIRRQDVGALTDRARTSLRQTYLKLHHRRAAAVWDEPAGLRRKEQPDLADLDGQLRAQLPVILLGWWDGVRYVEARTTTRTPAAPLPFLRQANGGRITAR
ncbi:hypothetical protein [Streptomyces gobiensis]|uniref:hypothetical protein n=1 Tax=Streptomyces gobiensis TaxID=2875706 RepID=UPI001E382B1C|nr:hypothetical protein [Streptomyces gobiensis]UGY94442.1 hypothetical protein test1122_23720 [Streptomyces gobiensis]